MINQATNPGHKMYKDPRTGEMIQVPVKGTTYNYPGGGTRTIMMYDQSNNRAMLKGDDGRHYMVPMRSIGVNLKGGTTGGIKEYSARDANYWYKNQQNAIDPNTSKVSQFYQKPNPEQRFDMQARPLPSTYRAPGENVIDDAKRAQTLQPVKAPITQTYRTGGIFYKYEI
jgi:hypothetical protein